MGRHSNKVREALKELKSNTTNTSEENLVVLARQKAGESLDIDISSKFKSVTERKIAKDLLQKYLNDYAIETISERNTLQEIIYLEVLQIRLQEKLNDFYEKDSKALPLNVIEIVHKNSDAIIRLKTTLGLNKSKDKKNAYDVLEHLQRRFKIWLEQNQASRTIKCPHCSKFIFLKMRTEAWEAQKHPFFRDNMIYNKALFAKFGQNVMIDKDFIASVLEVSQDYADWVVNKVKQQEQQDLTLKESTSDGTEEKAGEETSKETEVKPIVIEESQNNEQQTNSTEENPSI